MATSDIGRQIADNIFRQRKKNGLTQAQLAERVQMEKESISRIESGKITPSLNSLERFADVLGCPVVDLVRSASPDSQTQAETIAELIRPLPHAQREAIVRFVGEAVRLFSVKTG